MLDKKRVIICFCGQGLVPGLHRQIVFTGLRLGLYEELKALFSAGHGGAEEPIATKVAAALAVSAAGISLANPSDVVKVAIRKEGFRQTLQPFHCYPL